MPNNLYLAHHGILGMKWGVRRYQNADGTLTAAGKKHYGAKNSDFRVAAKKARDIAINDYNVKQSESKKAYDAYTDYVKTHPENEAEMFRKLEIVENGGSVEDEQSVLYKNVADKLAQERKAAQTIRNVESFLRGLDNGPMFLYDFEQGELGRQYVVALMNTEEYKDLFWDSKTGQLKKR